MKSLLGGLSRLVSGKSDSSQGSSSESDVSLPREVENPDSALVLFSNQRTGEATGQSEAHMVDPPPVIHMEYDTLFSTPQTTLPNQEAEASRTLDESLSFDAATKILLSESDSEPVVLRKEATKANRSSKRKKPEGTKVPELAKRLRSHKGKGLSEILSNQEYDPSRFISYEAQQRYAFFSHDKDRFIEEKDTVFGDEDSLKTVIEESGMLSTVTGIESYDPEAVWEFWANFPRIKPESGVYEVLVRDWLYEVSAARVNQLFGLSDVDIRTHKKNVAGILDEELAIFMTNGKINEWHQVTYSTFSADNKTLYKICCNNWLPTSNEAYVHPLRVKIIYMLHHRIPFNFGQLVCEHISQLAWSTQGKLKLPFPSLIYKLLMTQHPVPKTTTAAKREKRVKGATQSGKEHPKSKPISKKGASSAAADKKRFQRAIKLAIKILQNALDAGGDGSGSETDDGA